mmetsp:Transcript_32761/g.23689  ORF Transcript_32761/g.23689 Transcript_32761/m.23689 type:complete len:92 (+) Transcript_32761:469-744(+)
MGKNFPEFLADANRVLKPDGTLFVAEIASRFKDVNKFIKLMRSQAGFKTLKVSKLKDFFYIMVFQKVKDASLLDRTEEFSKQLKPCMYKRR